MQPEDLAPLTWQPAMKPRIVHVETNPHRSVSPVHVLLLRSNL